MGKSEHKKKNTNLAQDEEEGESPASTVNWYTNQNRYIVLMKFIEDRNIY